MKQFTIALFVLTICCTLFNRVQAQEDDIPACPCACADLPMPMIPDKTYDECTARCDDECRNSSNPQECSSCCKCCRRCFALLASQYSSSACQPTVSQPNVCQPTVCQVAVQPCQIPVQPCPSVGTACSSTTMRRIGIGGIFRGLFRCR